MKKEAFAAALLFLLTAASAWNIARIDRLTGDIIQALDLSQALAASGDFSEARQHMDKGLKLWLEADDYTHIFIRHPEIDSTTDAFYELQQLLLEADDEAFPAAYDKLRYHLDSIAGMEHIKPGSIL